jgi:hypothetical protein
MSGGGCLFPLNPTPHEHDPGGRLMAMGEQASALWHAVQVSTFASPLKKEEQLREAVRIRLDERAGWLAVRTSEFPAGDLAGAAQASLAIAAYYSELGQPELSSEWMQTALAEAPPNTIVRACVKYNLRRISGDTR